MNRFKKLCRVSYSHLETCLVAVIAVMAISASASANLLADTEISLTINKSDKRISEFNWNKSDIHVIKEILKDSKESYIVHFEGKYIRKGWELFCCKSIHNSEGKIYKAEPQKSGDGKFNIKFRTKKKNIQLLFTVIGPAGEFENETIDITVSKTPKPTIQKSAQIYHVPRKPSQKKVKKQITIYRVDKLGQLVPLNARAFGRWEWSRSTERAQEGPSYFPSYLTWIDMPKDYKILEVLDSVEPNKVIKLNPKTVPPGWKSNSNQVFKIQANEFDLVVNLKILNPKNESEKMSFIVAIDPVQKKTLVHQSCVKRGLWLKSAKTPSLLHPSMLSLSRLPFALLCQDDRKKLGVFTFFDSSTEISENWYQPHKGEAGSGVQSHVNSGSIFGWKFYEFAMPIHKNKLARYVLHSPSRNLRKEFELWVSKRGLASVNRNYEKASFKRSLSLSAGLALTSLSFKETTTSGFSIDYSALHTTLKVAGVYKLNSTWSLGANSYLNAFQISSNSSALTVRILGANLRVGYLLPVLRKPWALSLLGGVYYTDMLVSDSLIGYRHLAFLQVMPVLSRTIGRSRFIGYFKYVPIFHRSGSEVATGVSWVRFLKKPQKGIRSFSFSLDYSNLKQKNEKKTQDGKVQTFSVGAGIGW